MSFALESNVDGHIKVKKPRLKKNDDSLDNSQCFAPFRAIGLITIDQPFILQTKGIEHFAITCIGPSYHIYKCSKLALSYVGPQHAKRIRCMAALKDYIFVGTGNQVLVWKRSALIRHFDLPRHCKPTLLHVFGQHILVYSAADNTLRMWHIFDGSLYTTIQFPANFNVSCIMHPETYLNKILFGSSEGALQIWNLKTNKLIYTFKGWNSGVKCIEQSPAVDVVAIGLSNGKIIIHNLKVDQTITQFHQAEGAVTSLSFRTGIGSIFLTKYTDSHPILASGGPTGSIAIWDLEKKKLASILPSAHNKVVSCIRFLHAEPVMISSGDDNSLKMWIFDNSDGTARLLRSRDGHYQTPSMIRYYGNRPQILSCAEDKQLRLFNTFIDSQNREISQGKHIISKARRYGTNVEQLKLPSILHFDASPAKEREWDNIITCHQDNNKAYTWNFENKTQGKHTLLTKDPKQTSIRSVAISSCGNYGIIGTAGGWIDKFNMQSGIHRGSCIDGERAHDASVQGLCTDSLNRHLISISLDGAVKIWDFKTLQLLHKIEIGFPIDKLVFHKDNNLLAVTCDDLTVRVYDIETLKLVRKFEGHSNRISDLALSPDGRWLVTASGDIIRVFDLPTSTLIDWFRVKGLVRSISFSWTGDFLAASIVGSIGIYMWANKDYFGKVFFHPIPNEPPLLKTPTTTGSVEEEYEEEEAEELPPITNVSKEDEEMLSIVEDRTPSKETDGKSEIEYSVFEPLSEDLITLSSVPKARWQSIANIDLIKKRNKPTEPPKKPEQAPFFLPTLAGGDDPIFVPPKEQVVESESRILHFADIGMNTPFMEALNKGFKLNDYSEALEFLKKSSPSAIDFEFQVLSNQENFKQLKMVLKMLEFQLDSNKDYELVQAYLNVFLKHHSDTIAKNPELTPFIQSLKSKQREHWLRLQSLFHNSLCLVKFFSGIQT